jgi:DNA polymerase-4
MRKIVHIDMDAFYASVEQRDQPDLKGKPVVVAWRGQRSVVCAASYEARRYGIRSAMPALRAEKMCPDAIFLPPDFTRYREVSQQIREIFVSHTDLVEPLSLDEAYLDVTENKAGLGSATEVAEMIRAQIQERTTLTASAGVAPNKFLAKIASDWRKPNGIFIVRPHQIEQFLKDLPVKKLPGVGKATQSTLSGMGVTAVSDLLQFEIRELESRFGRFGARLYNLARGIDHNEVRPDRPRKSISSEQTFESDLSLGELTVPTQSAAERTWIHATKSDRIGRTVVLKLKTSDFQSITRSLTPSVRPTSLEELSAVALQLLDRVDLPATTRYRLVGVGLSNFVDSDEASMQSTLFDEI